MDTIIRRHTWLNVLSLLLALPTAWFICINLLNESGISGLYNASQPYLNEWVLTTTLDGTSTC